MSSISKLFLLLFGEARILITFLKKLQKDECKWTGESASARPQQPHVAPFPKFRKLFV